MPCCRVQSSNGVFVRNSPIYFLGLLTCAAVLVQAFASGDSSSRPLSPWGTRGGAHAGVVSKSQKHTGRRSAPSSLPESEDKAEEANASYGPNDDRMVEIPSPSIIVNGSSGAVPDAAVAPLHGDVPPPHGPAKAKKTIVTAGGFSDEIIDAHYVAETNLPTDVGHFRLRAYRLAGQEDASPHPLGAGAGLGSEPCLIYATDKPPFGGNGAEGAGLRGVPVRIHDQCFTSEVFRSQR